MIKKTIKYPAQGRNIDYKYKNTNLKSNETSSQSSTSSILENYISYDFENDVIRVNKTITSDYDVIAYAANSEIGSIWDGMPVATASNLGGVKVDSSNSDIYLDSNDVLQVDFSNVTTENTYVNDVSFSNDTLTLTLNDNTTLETTIESGVWDETESGISYSNNVQIGGNTTISGDLTVNGTEFITNTETVE
ncbi:MAG: hypothetical protein ACOCUI_00070, partial [bacterium]